MKKEIIIILNILLLFIVCLTGCGNVKLSEEDMVESLPDAIKTIYVNDATYILDVESLEVEKRKTDEDVDTVYCTIVLNNDNYRSTKKYALYYSYYDKGGWILDDWNIMDSYTEITNGISQELTDAEISLYYFDDYQFVEQVNNVEKNVSYTTYQVNYLSDNYSYNGIIKLESSFVSSWEGGNWIHSLSYDNSFEWNVQGIWAGDSEDITGTRMSGTAIEIDIQTVNQDEGYVEFLATEYRTNTRKGYYVDETGNIKAHIEPVLKKETDELRYQVPIFTFEFIVKESEYRVRIKPNEIIVSAGGYGGTVSGNIYKGYAINVWKNDYGWPQLDKVLK